MRRILAISIAAAIPAVLPVHAVDAISYPVDKPAPPVAGGHYRPAPARAHHAKHAAHGRPAPAPVGETRNEPARGPENDVKIDADDGSGPEAQDQQGAPQHNAVGSTGRGAHKSTRNRPSRSAHGRPAASPGIRPGTGADSGFADADDPALPPEAAAAIKEATDLQESAQQAAGPRQDAPAATTPGATTPGATTPGAGAGTPNAGTPGAGTSNATPSAPAPQGGAIARPAAPRNAGRARPANPVTDESFNQKLNRLAGPRTMPVAYFNAIPGARGARLVLHTIAGTAPEHTATLQCDPPGGTHPRAAEACADVSRAGGDLAQMPTSKNPRACFMIYAPVTVTAQGSWHGQPVRFNKKYPNTCVMRDKTGSVFDF
jgi:Subtilisin inhibitor-like